MAELERHHAATEISDSAENAELAELRIDARLGGVLDSLSALVRDAFAELGAVQNDVRAEARVIDERRSEIERQRGKLKEEKAALERESAAFASRAQAIAAREAEITERAERLADRERETRARRQALEASESELGGKAAALREKEAALRELEAGLERREAGLGQREAEVAAATADAESKSVALEKRVRVLNGRENELAEKSALLSARDADLTERTKALEERESAVRSASDELDYRRAQLDETGAALNALAGELEERESLVQEAEACVEERSAALRARESVISEYYLLLASFQQAIVEAPVAEESEPERDASVDTETVSRADGGTQGDGSFAPDVPSGEACALEPGEFPGDDCDLGDLSLASYDGVADEAVVESSTKDGEAPTPIDVSDFSPDELARFSTRRRLQAYSDEFIAAEIRAERKNGRGSAKRRGWFRR